MNRRPLKTRLAPQNSYRSSTKQKSGRYELSPVYFINLCSCLGWLHLLIILLAIDWGKPRKGWSFVDTNIQKWDVSTLFALLSWTGLGLGQFTISPVADQYLSSIRVLFSISDVEEADTPFEEEEGEGSEEEVTGLYPIRTAVSISKVYLFSLPYYIIR